MRLDVGFLFENSGDFRLWESVLAKRACLLHFSPKEVQFSKDVICVDFVGEAVHICEKIAAQVRGWEVVGGRAELCELELLDLILEVDILEFSHFRAAGEHAHAVETVLGHEVKRVVDGDALAEDVLGREVDHLEFLHRINTQTYAPPGRDEARCRRPAHAPSLGAQSTWRQSFGRRNPWAVSESPAHSTLAACAARTGGAH